MRQVAETKQKKLSEVRGAETGGESARIIGSAGL